MKYLFGAVIACAAVCGAAMAGFTPAGVKLALKVVPVVEVRLAKPEVAATLTLSNAAIADTDLNVGNPCKIRQWQVVDARQVRVGGQDGCSNVTQPQYRTLLGGESVSETVMLPLTGVDLRENETYVLRYRYWDIPVEARFKIKLVK
ncbi:MAG: hypothetical protein WCD42_05070 [Rhizomicrobium sp.]